MNALPGAAWFKRGYWRWGVAITLLTLLASAIPVRGVAAVLRRAELGPLLFAAAVSFGMHGIQTVRLRLLARELGLRWSGSAVARIHFGSLAYALVLPAGNVASMFLRAYRLGQGQKDFVAAGGVILLDRLLSTATLATTGLVLLPFGGLERPALLWGLFLAIACAAFGMLAVAVLGPEKLPGYATVKGIPGLGRWFGRIEAVPRPSISMFLLLVGMAFVIHMTGIVAFKLAAMSLGLSLSFGEVGLARAVMLVAALLPVSVAGLGLREGAALLVFGAWGESSAAALGLSFLVFVCVWLLPGLAGAVLEVFGLVGTRRVPEQTAPQR